MWEKKEIRSDRIRSNNNRRISDLPIFGDDKVLDTCALACILIPSHNISTRDR